MNALNFAALKEGEELEALVKDPITKVQLVKYAGASGDFNPIHTDDETAKTVGLGGVIAHGMLSMGFLGEYAAALAGPDGWVEELSVRFGSMVRPGDVLTCKGTVKELTQSGGRGHVRLSVWCETQKGEQPTKGEAVLSLPA
ncbi:MAG: MaoC family dehydratase N-terminal domain-containing protein [Firmicutes bacterium]|nr:MaoC family dehydratase N-terminal domain-containing protein [Bacillota bacterium]